MSLKDDFLEALRSVKRDFFKDYEYTGSDDGGSPQMGASPQPQQRPDPIREESMATEPTQAQRPQEPVRQEPPSTDYNAASAQWEPEAIRSEVHSSEDTGADAFDEDTLGPDVDTTPYRVADDAGEGSDFSDFLPGNDYSDGDSGSGGGLIPPNDGRVIFDDFDADDYTGGEKTVISKNTIIRGALQTEDSVRMFGQIMGDIDCKSNILVAGKVRGNTSAANAYIIDAQVDGNLLCDDVVNVNDDAWILGNIRAQQA